MKVFLKAAVLILSAVLLVGTLSACGEKKAGSSGSGSETDNAETGDFNKYSYNVSVSLPGQSGVAFLNEKAEIVVKIDNVSDYRTKNGKVKFDVGFIYGGDPKVTEVPFDETKSADGITEVKLAVDTNILGYWGLDIDISLGENNLDKISRAYAVVNKPKNYGKVDPGSFFGTMFVPDGEAAQRIGVKHDRVCAYWRFTQRADGTYDWSGLDHQFDICEAGNISIDLMIQPEVLLQGAILPGYEITSAEDIIRPDVLEGCKKWMREMIKRYKDRVSAIEIINEPDMNFTLWAGVSAERTGEIVAKVMAEGYKIVKQEAPHIPVVGLSVSEREYYNIDSGKPTSTEWIFKAAKGQKLADIFSIHPYSTKWDISSSTRHLTPEEYGLFKYLKNGVQYAKSKGMNTVYMTEVGYTVRYDEPLLSHYRQIHAALAARAMIMCKAFPEIKVGMYFDAYYEQAGDSTTSMSLFNGSKKYGYFFPNPAAASFAAMSYILHDAKPVEVINNGEGEGKSNRLGAYRFETDTQSVVAIWKDRIAQDAEINGVASLEAFDIYGNSLGKGNLKIALGDNPTYLVCDKAEGAKLSTAVKQAIQG